MEVRSLLVDGIWGCATACALLVQMRCTTCADDAHSLCRWVALLCTVNNSDYRLFYEGAADLEETVAFSGYEGFAILEEIDAEVTEETCGLKEFEVDFC